MIYRMIAAALMLSSGLAAAQAQPVAGEQGGASARPAAAPVPVTKEQVSLRIESVGKLLETSSASQQIESNKDERAIAQREKARDTYKAARAAFAAGEYQQASTLLTLSSTQMFEAVRFAGAGEVTGKNAESEFKAKHESVKSLLSAYKRIAAEKSTVKGVNEAVANIDKLVADALKLAGAGKYLEANVELDRAYVVAKAGVGGLRSGDTLVRSLNFANKEEEYHYEVDRNDTHQMLLSAVLEEKRTSSPQLAQQVSGLLSKAKEMRVAAEASAKAKDFIQAIKQLEDSTIELVRAIRNAGVYIPG